jgi:hypothetical protein
MAVTSIAMFHSNRAVNGYSDAGAIGLTKDHPQRCNLPSAGTGRPAPLKSRAFICLLLTPIAA